MNTTKIAIAIFALCGFATSSCSDTDKTATTTTSLAMIGSTPKKPKKQLSETFRKYWYDGTAEISSYTLEQARYAEIHSGNAVLIYVTEDFLPKIQVKADQQSAENIPVLKLNSTKKFLTGIYPYSVMQSAFYPVADNQHALKVTSSMQEWCGHVYTQLNNKDQFEVVSHSYFQGEADQEFRINKTILENELWTKIRIDPNNLPTGTQQTIPALEYVRMKHIALKPYEARMSLTSTDNVSTYEITYPELKRALKIRFTQDFPHKILGWEESFISFGKPLTTKATLKKAIKTAYWGQHSNRDLKLRDSLQL